MPLLNDGGIVRGWVVVEDEIFEAASETLANTCGKSVEIEVRRSYSAQQIYADFESKIHH